MMKNKILLLTDENIYKLYILDKVKRYIDKLKFKNVKIVKSIKATIGRLAERIPNKPEQWRNIKGCENLFELKIKPYRLACYMKGMNILILHI
jgi:mRNA-degrading endonuclease RelE of RelBE toxin-antitoxin system